MHTISLVRNRYIESMLPCELWHSQSTCQTPSDHAGKTFGYVYRDVTRQLPAVQMQLLKLGVQLGEL